MTSLVMVVMICDEGLNVESDTNATKLRMAGTSRDSDEPAKER